MTRRVAWTNVPHAVVDLSSVGYDWGSFGVGTYDLALNLLEAVLTARGHRGPRSQARRGTAFTLALHHRTRFAEEFLAGIPDEGGTLPTSSVAQWLDERDAEMSPCERSLFSSRYRLIDGTGHWSASEVEQVLGNPPVELLSEFYSPRGELLASWVEAHPLDQQEWETSPL